MSFWVHRDFFSLKSKQPSPKLNRLGDKLRLTALRLRYVHLLDSVGGERRLVSGDHLRRAGVKSQSFFE